ncbi:MAG TPA: DegT/DnrJ/EryC1/StrS family aminotransferase [Polyangia bacterium]|nr:DegT/DnrJ/EryC1/StrS family aminotransferase [Polyangia bacterium]
MNRIPFLDLGAQHLSLKDDLRAAAARVLASGSFILGPEVVAFERELAAELGVAEAVGVSSGTDALTALLMAAGVGQGDEVVTTPYSFFATVESIVRLGARPVFADIEPETMNLDAAAAVARVGSRTKAVLMVHLFGRVAGVGLPLRAACSAGDIPLLEDAAQAIGASGARGGWGAALSFFPSKNLGGFGDGGAVTTNDAALAAQVRALRNHGALQKLQHDRIGGNFRLDELQAALLRVKLPHLSGWTAERRRLAALYRERLAGSPIGLPPPDAGCVWNQFVIRVPAARRDLLRRHLEERGIASAVYYPIPLHLQPALAFLGHRPGDFPNAERAAEESLALPIFPGLTDGDLSRVADAAGDFFR